MPYQSTRPIVAQRKVEPAPTQLPSNLPAPDTLPVAAQPATAPEKDAAKEAPILQTALDTSRASSIAEPGSVRRAFVDITAQPSFAHAEDYSWLNGQLQHTHKGWRLRYASVDEVDQYGGSVTLTDESKLSEMKDGDLVRVHGRLLNMEDRRIDPPYDMLSIQAIQKRE